MPLTRYQIRNEYSLADPELYKAADRDDPEALLEGVAMAGLVGVLRQLGDLAEFAAEIFHDLHEEVMTTAARGHGLMFRVQQLEAEFPSIEKAFLSQTNHSSFFSNAGIEWHPKLQMEQNLITRGDLPRCVMDSYEECRGPPRFFLLDKFDVAGAGACLKRYTDPSFFKVEAAPSETSSAEVQREKKIRKAKKKGSRWRNRETPEIVPTSHAKLHQLFLEESIEKGHSDPARLVKLKKRQLNVSPFESGSGKSYMEKFLETTPKCSVVCDISVTPLPLQMTSDNSSELGLEIHDISTVSPVKKSSQGNESTCTSPDACEVLLKPSMYELCGEVIDRQIVKVPEPSSCGERDEIPSSLHKMTIEKEIVVDEEGKMDGSVEGDNSDDMTSEVDNYMDALTTMESEVETDSEYRPKTGLGFSNAEKHTRDSDRNGEQQELQVHSLDSQSIGNFSASDDGNSSFNKGRSSFSYSDTLSNLAENTPSDGEGSIKVIPSSEALVPEITDTPSNQLPADVGVLGTKSHDLVLPNDVSIDEANSCDLVEASSNSSLIDSNPLLLALDPTESSPQQKLDETSSETMKPGTELSYMDKRETNMDDSSSVVSDMPSQTRDSALFTVCAENHPVDKLGGGDPNISSDDMLHLSTNSELALGKKSSNDCPDKGIQTEFGEEICPENMASIKIGSPHSTTSPRKEQGSTLPEVKVYSGFKLLSDSSDCGKCDDVVSTDDDAFLENSTFMVDTSQNCSFKELQVSDMVVDVPPVEVDLAEKAALYSEETNLADISGPTDGEKIGVSTFKVEAMVGDSVPFDLPSNLADSSVLEDHVGFDDVVAEGVQAENMIVSATATDDVPAEACVDDVMDTVVRSPPGIICSPTEDDVSLQESPSGTEDPHKDDLEFNKLVSPEYLRGSEAENEMTQLEVAPKDFDSASSNLFSYDESNLEMVHGVYKLCLAETTQNSLSGGDVTVPPTSSELSNQEVESKYFHQNRLIEDGKDDISSPAAHLPDPNTSLEQSPELQADQLDVEWMKAAARLDSPTHLSEGIQSSNNTTQERLFNDASVSCQEDLSSQPSPSECLRKSAGQEINSTKPEMDPLGCVLPSFGLLHEATQVNLEEMPPLPPLPPMQWRLGKIQHAPLFSQSELIDLSQESFLSFFPFGDREKARSGFPSQQGRNLQPVNLYLPVSAIEDENLQHVSEQEVGKETWPILSSLPLPYIANDANQKNSLALERTQSLNPFLTSSALHDEKPEHGFLTSKSEEVQSSSNPFSSLPAVGFKTSKHDPVSLPEKLIHPLNELEQEPGLDCKTLQGSPENSEGERGNPSDTSALPPGKVEGQHQHNLLSSDGKTLQGTPANSEGDHGNPSDTFVLPPGKVEEQPQHSLLSSDGKTLQGTPENSEGEWGNPSDTSALPPEMVKEQPQHPPGMVEEQPQHGLLSSDSKTLQHIPEISQGELRNPSDTSVLPPGKYEEQPQHGLLSSEGESAWSSDPFALLPTSEVGNANGSSVVKLPRPRNPLIDAVAAIDKSKLRKVTERVQPQSGPKVDDRDSLLEQIRNKSFNLKPAAVSRPSIHGPKTNLKVAAILEKANAIRLATAGSDEDDDEDWSDS